jgi:hypothetical protein
MRRRLSFSFALLLVLASASLAAQEFFAGVVSHIDAKRINVSRTLVGRSPESHAFVIDPSTKMPKGIKNRTRVTVRYEHRPEGDFALEIQIRPPDRITKTP